MTKTKTWKKHRNARRALTEEPNYVDLDEARKIYDELLKPNGWRWVWSDCHDGTQIAYLGFKRKSDAFCPLAVKVHAGHGETYEVIERGDLDRLHGLITSPPAIVTEAERASRFNV